MSANNDMHNDQENGKSYVNNKSNMPLTGKSIARKNFSAGEAVFLSFDVETGGDHCGIVQLLCQIFRIIPGTSSSDPPKIVTTKDDIYNKYVKPPEGAMWSKHAINIHGITPSDNRVQLAETIETLWTDFCTFVDSCIGLNEVGILLAYNGETLVQVADNLSCFPVQLLAEFTENFGTKIMRCRTHRRYNYSELLQKVILVYMKLCHNNSAHNHFQPKVTKQKLLLWS